MAWRVNVGATGYIDKFGNKKMVRFGQVGMSDIFAISPTGQFTAIEVKKPSTRKKVTRFQQQFLDLVNMHNGLGFVATSIEDVRQSLKLP